MMSSVGYRRRLLMWAGCSRYGHRLIAPLFAPSVEVYVSYLPSGEMVSADDVCCAVTIRGAVSESGGIIALKMNQLSSHRN
jgi:hypothetical protein